MLLGNDSRIATIDHSAATCHHTETLFMSAIRWLLKMLSTDASASTATKIRKTRVSV